MPRNSRRRRQRSPRRLPPRPTIGAREPAAAEARSAGARVAAPVTRPARLVARETPYVMAELRRVFLISATCFALLALLVAVDRLS